MISALTVMAAQASRAASTSPSLPAITPADALDEAPPPAAKAGGLRIDVLQVKPLSGLPLISVADNAALRDLMARNWLTTHGAHAAQRSVSDAAPDNMFAQVKVDGQVVATLYNGGSSVMTNAAAAMIGDLQDPPGLAGPDLARWRADRYAEALGGVVEKASTALSPSQWTPRESNTPAYTREQLDAAFQAMVDEGKNAAARLQATYPAEQPSGARTTDLSA